MVAPVTKIENIETRTETSLEDYEDPHVPRYVYIFLLFF